MQHQKLPPTKQGCHTRGAFHEATCRWFSPTKLICSQPIKCKDSVAYNICRWKSPTKSFMKWSPGVAFVAHTLCWKACKGILVHSDLANEPSMTSNPFTCWISGHWVINYEKLGLQIINSLRETVIFINWVWSTEWKKSQTDAHDAYNYVQILN